jgi:hypothetical protein
MSDLWQFSPNLHNLVYLVWLLSLDSICYAQCLPNPPVFTFAIALFIPPFRPVIPSLSLTLVEMITYSLRSMSNSFSLWPLLTQSCPLPFEFLLLLSLTQSTLGTTSIRNCLFPVSAFASVSFSHYRHRIFLIYLSTLQALDYSRITDCLETLYLSLHENSQSSLFLWILTIAM